MLMQLLQHVASDGDFWRSRSKTGVSSRTKEGGHSKLPRMVLGFIYRPPPQRLVIVTR